MTFRNVFTAAAVISLSLAGTARADEPAKAAPTPDATKPRPSNISPQTAFINDQLAKAWAANSLTPSAKADDYEFSRRVFLDLIGRIPRADEVKAFVASGDRNKRTHLVQKLLNDKNYVEEYSRNWAGIWTVWLMTRSGNPTYHNQMKLWLEEQFAKNVSHKDMVTSLLTATGKTDENQAVNYILANLGEATPREKRRDEGHFEAVPITSRTTRLFLGLQTQCVQCHDHPFNPDWKQSSFWGVNVFFRQVDRKGNPNLRQNPMMNIAPVLELTDDDKVNTAAVVYYERRNGMIMPTKPTFLDGSRPEPSEGKSRRKQLAELVVKHENFPKEYVNRIWGHLFGRGLNEQPVVDDFGEHNKVIHPELLDKLARDFAGYADYNPKELLTWICTSDAYQLSSAPNKTNEKPETDVFFSRMPLKALSPEQLIESLWVATHGQSGSQLGDSKEAERKRAAWTSSLVRNFGDDEGNEVNFNGTVVQALLMMNGREINEAIRDPNGTVVRAINASKGNHNTVVKQIYMAALSRPPSGNEPGIIGRVADRSYGKRDATFYADVMWALLNSNEFILNH